MRIGRNTTDYLFESLHDIPQEVLDNLGITLVGFSSNPYHPIISYKFTTDNPKFKEIIDYVIAHEVRP